MGTWARRRPLHLSRYARAPADRAESLDGITLRDRTVRENARRAAVRRGQGLVSVRQLGRTDLGDMAFQLERYSRRLLTDRWAVQRAG